MTESQSVHQNPFFLLGASSRDDRRRVIELADARSLELSESVCQKARSDLTNPRSRVVAEVGWLPGLSPARAEQLSKAAAISPLSISDENNIPDLSKANLLATALQCLPPSAHSAEVARLIEDLADTVDRLDEMAILRDINEDRSISGFPLIASVDIVSPVLAEHKRYYQNAAKVALNRLPSKQIVEVVTELVDDATIGGDFHAPQLIDELVDNYELEARAFLDSEAVNVYRLLDLIREIAPRGEAAVIPSVVELERVVQNWDIVAQPIQLSAKARGIAHQPSRQLAFKVRSLAIDLWNDHKLLNISRRLTSMLGEVFAEVPDVRERLEDDHAALERLAAERASEVEEKEDPSSDAPFEARIGIMRHTLRLTDDGITWKDRFHPLGLITKVRWGGISRSLNGIPTGSDFTIGFGNDHYSAVIETGSSKIYSEFLERFWPAVCIRLLVELLRSLGGGRQQMIGQTLYSDTSVVLQKRKIFGKPTDVEVPWTGVRTVSEGGQFSIVSKTDNSVYATFPYLTTWNAHILEHVVELGLKKRVFRLSELLGG
ncbi:MAG TPA: hypothetical protein VJL35_05425 [Gemmatimonadaceae bacterium]|nr:hypothetical protein [Gemmatimonadaceae bacterium]